METLVLPDVVLGPHRSTMSRRVAGRARGQSEASSLFPGSKGKKNFEEFGKTSQKPRSIVDIGNELEFSQWYNEVEGSLLETSYDEYQ